MIDIMSETPISLHEAARLVGTGKRGRPTHISSVLRWVVSGCKAPGGRKVRLEAVRIGSTWRTSREALQRFCEALTPQLDAEPPPAPSSPTARRRASERAAEALERAGI